MSRPYPLPTAPDHDLHDPLLVAQFTAGDALEADEYARAQLWAGSCGACARLAADLRAVSGAVAWEPTPPRRRDLRLTQERAEQLRGNPFSRLMRRLALPQSARLRPAAAGVMSIGLLLVVAGTAWEETGVPQTVPAAAPAVGTQDRLELRSELDVLPSAPAPAVGFEAPALDPEQSFAEMVEPDGVARDDVTEFEVFRAEEGLDAASDAVTEGAPAAAAEAAGTSVDDADAAEPGAPGADAQSLDEASEARARNAKVVDGAESGPEAPLEGAAPTVGFLDVGATSEDERQAVATGGSEGLVLSEVAAPADEPGLESMAVAVGLLMAIAGAVLLLLVWLARRRADPLLR